MDSETIKTFRKTIRRVQEKNAKKYVEEVKEEASKYGISVETIYFSGDPAEELLKAIDK